MPIEDPYRGNPSVAGAGIPFAVTPSDNDQTVVMRAVRVDADGQITLMPAYQIPGSNLPITPITINVKAGEVIPGFWKQVRQTDTNVTGTIMAWA